MGFKRCADRVVLSAAFLTCFTFILITSSYLVVDLIVSRKVVGQLNKDSVFITGCDSGFGNLLAKSLDKRGVKVFAGFLTDEVAAQLESETSSHLQTLVVDITQRESVKKALDFISRRIGSEDFERVLHVNITGTLSVAHAFLPLLRKSRGNRLREFFNSGLKVITIEPGGFRTNLTEQESLANMVHKGFKTETKEQQDVYGGNIAEYIMGGVRLASQYVSNRPQSVAEAMAHALLAKYPRMCYPVGYDAYIFFGFMRMIPERVGDYILGWPAPHGRQCEDFKQHND
ncbi:retinol dehydrogenase 7-like [Mya arenaria]|uniref:retinol dehydrogenase 7-like n=1 Tax=Mya arenaria TaxID=6604 RepID=UPI0022E7AB8E|nr:retinol dehydrogenase 7-like [Mya arenaria]